jgi:hypothetical protein
MQTKTWKKERDLLEEAYGSINETDHSTLRAAQTDEENADDDRKAAGLKAQGKQMEDDLKEEEGDKKVTGEASDTVEMAMMDRPAADEELPEPGEEGLEHEPDEVDHEIESLKNLILNPPVDKIEEYAKQGQLHVYVDMLKKKLEAAEAVKAAVRGETE